MDFQTFLDDMSDGVSGYTEVIDQLSSDVDDVIDAIGKLSDEGWKGLSQQEFNKKVQVWADNCSILINGLECLRDAINNNLPKIDEKLKQGQSLER